VSLQPAAGAHGEMTALLVAAAYFHDRRESRSVVLIPDAAHGTNPASATMAGFKAVPVTSTPEGFVDVDELAARLDDQTAISLQIRKQSGTNTVRVVDNILERLERIKPNLPPDVRIFTLRDQSRFIRKSVQDIQHHLVLGGLFASIVVFFFIRNLRSTVIAALAIPTSIIGTFTLMSALGFTLNNMTMLALSLATAIVIDDAIVVLENIFRYVEEKGVPPREAAALATNEIGLAVMATTFTLIAVFVPVAFMKGIIGRFFFQFGQVALAAAEQNSEAIVRARNDHGQAVRFQAHESAIAQAVAESDGVVIVLRHGVDLLLQRGAKLRARLLVQRNLDVVEL
jgi:hypothetical protein